MSISNVTPYNWATALLKKEHIAYHIKVAKVNNLIVNLCLPQPPSVTGMVKLSSFLKNQMEF